jgi:hypothetical protein
MSVIALAGCDTTVTHGENSSGMKMCSRIDGIEQQATTETSARATMYALMWFEAAGDPCNIGDVNGSATVAADRMATELTIYKNGTACAYVAPKWNTSQTDSHSGFASCGTTINDGNTDGFTGTVVFRYRNNGVTSVYTSSALALTL